MAVYQQIPYIFVVSPRRPRADTQYMHRVTYGSNTAPGVDRPIDDQAAENRSYERAP